MELYKVSNPNTEEAWLVQDTSGGRKHGTDGLKEATLKSPVLKICIFLILPRLAITIYFSSSELICNNLLRNYLPNDILSELFINIHVYTCVY